MPYFYILTLTPLRPDGSRGPSLTVNQITDESDPLSRFGEAQKRAEEYWFKRYGGDVSHFVVDHWSVEADA